MVCVCSKKGSPRIDHTLRANGTKSVYCKAFLEKNLQCRLNLTQTTMVKSTIVIVLSDLCFFFRSNVLRLLSVQSKN